MAQLPVARKSPQVARRRPSFMNRSASGELRAIRAARFIACGNAADQRIDRRRSECRFDLVIAASVQRIAPFRSIEGDQRDRAGDIVFQKLEVAFRLPSLRARSDAMTKARNQRRGEDERWLHPNL